MRIVHLRMRQVIVANQVRQLFSNFLEFSVQTRPAATNLPNLEAWQQKRLESAFLGGRKNVQVRCSSNTSLTSTVQGDQAVH